MRDVLILDGYLADPWRRGGYYLNIAVVHDLLHKYRHLRLFPRNDTAKAFSLIHHLNPTDGCHLFCHRTKRHNSSSTSTT